MFDRLNTSLTSLCICALMVVGICIGSHNSSVMAAEHGQLSVSTLRELAAARAGTARYQNVEQAEADGYVNIDLYLSGEGFHYVNFSLIDGTFDPAHPEVLLYAPVGDDSKLRLVGAEYLVPLALSAEPPQGFTGDADEWREDSEGFGLWEINAWIWMNNPEGIFGHDNPRIP